MIKKYKLIITTILLILVFIVITTCYFYNKNSQVILSFEDYTSISIDFIDDFQERLEIKTGKEVNGSSIESGLGLIDTMYHDGIINISEELFFIPPATCIKEPCLSIREMYFFSNNLNFYE